MSNKNASLKSGIRDNLLRETVHDFLEQEIKNGSALSIVSAYFTIYAYEKMQHTLNKIEKLRFLFGDPDFVKRMDPNNTDKKAFDITDTGLALNQQLRQKPVAKACAEWIKEKVEIRTTRQSNLIHGKMYHIANNSIDKAILGSSNFTVRGLGLSSNNSNIELNLEVDSDRDRTDLKAWFDELWNNDELVEDVKDKVLAKLKQIGQDHPPELIYYKTLYELFREEIETRKTDEQTLEDIHLYDTKIWDKLYDFQRDGAKSVIARLLRHNGCILADSVGLGKTYTALAVIKFFLLLTDEQQNLTQRTFFPEDTTTQQFTTPTITLDHICYVSVGMVVHADEKRAEGEFGLKDLVSDEKDEFHPKPFVEGKYLDRWVPATQKWLEWGTNRAPALFRRRTFPELYEVDEKLISISISASAEKLRVVYDNSKLYHNHSAWSFVPWHALAGVRNRSIQKQTRYRDEKKNPDLPNREDIEKISRCFTVKFLIGIMNSSCVRDFLRANRRSNLNLYPDDWKKLPVPDVSPEQQTPIIALVDKILDAKRTNPDADISDLESKVDKLVYELYNLTAGEIAIVETHE